MNDYSYKKKMTLQQNKENTPPEPQMTNGIPNSVLNEVFAGKRRATSEMMGHKETLAPSVAAKMSRAFGMDLTQLQLYRSEKMSGTGMKGISQGNKVVLSSDIDLNTGAGQAVLGHELSHIHAQSQGIGMGNSGLYKNASLERQADKEGLLAAHGRPIYDTGMPENPGLSYGLGMKGVEGLTPISGGLSASAGAPMQAKEDKDRKNAQSGFEKKFEKYNKSFGEEDIEQKGKTIDTTEAALGDLATFLNTVVDKKNNTTNYNYLTDEQKKKFKNAPTSKKDMQKKLRNLKSAFQRHFFYAKFMCI